MRARNTDGAFDPALGRLFLLWDVEHRREPPPPEVVASLAGRHLYRGLDLDRWQGRPAIRFTSGDVRVDLGGIAAGYGVDQAVAALREWGVRDAIVNLAGDLYAMGRSEDGNPWRVGIRSPDRADLLVASLDIEDAAVTTSGDYVKFFEYRGRRYHHLLDPETGAPRTAAMHSVTVQDTRLHDGGRGRHSVFRGRSGGSTPLARSGRRPYHSFDLMIREDVRT